MAARQAHIAEGDFGRNFAELFSGLGIPHRHF
jgi:hypothetical protein